MSSKSASAMPSPRGSRALAVVLVAFAGVSGAIARGLFVAQGNPDGPHPFSVVGGVVLAVCAALAVLVAVLLVVATRRSNDR
jgi:hypothetical protein